MRTPFIQKRRLELQRVGCGFVICFTQRHNASAL
jgi:hypothetical protein